MTLLKHFFLGATLASNTSILLYVFYTSLVATLPVNNFILGAWIALLNPLLALTYVTLTEFPR